MIIRPYKIGEEQALRKVFYSAIHQVANQYYSQKQLNAWAPDSYDVQWWCERIAFIKPFVVELEGHIVGYADL